MKAEVYVPTRGHVFVDVITRLAPYNPNYIREKASIASCRNQIVYDFLSGDADILVMVDDDTIPPLNFVNDLAEGLGTFDIIGAPTPIARPGTGFIPNTFDVYLDHVRYPITWPEGLRTVGGIGTGCIMIPRKVLEHKWMTAPFSPPFDKHGVLAEGEDIAFCRRARNAGFRIGANFDVVCDHFTAIHALALRDAYGGTG